MSFTAGAGTRYVVTSTTNPSGGITPSVPFLGPLTFTAGTATTNTPAFDITQTWNNAGVTFTGFRFNVTDTASNAGSLLMDLQVGGVSRFSVSKSGAIGVSNISLTGFVSGATFVATNQLVLDVANQDVVLRRDAANTLAQRNGVNPQTFNVYNTFTDASNYERGVLQWAANILTIGAQSAGTGSARDVVLQGGNRLYLRAGGVTSWEINAANGHILAVTDNAFDIGASGANRPRTVFAATSVLAPYVRTATAYTVATLPAAGTAGAGARAYVTDASATTFASVVAGGGANIVPVMSNGTNWIIG